MRSDSDVRPDAHGSAAGVRWSTAPSATSLPRLRNLSAEQVERILAHQREHGMRFGEAAVQLGFASNDDVLFALAQQFHYPYAPEEQRKLSPELVALNEPFSAQAEAFRAMRSQLMMRVFNDQQEPRRALAVISPSPATARPSSPPTWP